MVPAGAVAVKEALLLAQMVSGLAAGAAGNGWTVILITSL
jgi:hypothetical protein